MFDDVARSWRAGEWPLLSPYSWVCGNLAGEYQYGTFSVFVNVAIIGTWTFFSSFAHQAAVISIVHLIVLATGAFLLARQRNLSVPLATMVGLVAALNGWIICWGASDWFGALGAFAWLPWAWWGCEKALVLTATSMRWRFLWPAPFVYLLATGGFPYTVLMLGLLVAWLTIRSLVRTRSLFAPLPMLFGVALGFGMSAPAILALLAYVHGSAREAQPASAHWQWIVPPGALPGLILPNWTVKWADFSTRYTPHTGAELACGLVAPAAVLYGLIRSSGAVFRRLGWELMLLAIVLIIAMIPTAGLFRWSFRWLPFFHLVVAICAAECLNLLGKTNGSTPSRRPVAVFSLVLVGLTALAATLFQTGGRYFFPLTAVLLGICALWIALELVPARSIGLTPWLPAAISFVSLLATYFWIPPDCGVPRYPFTEALLDPAPLDPARLYLSVYPAPELAYRMEAHPQPVGQIVRPGSTSMWAKLHFVNGYSPIRPAGVAKQFYFTIHGELDPGMARLLLMKEAGQDGVLARMGVDGITMAKEMEFDPEPAGEWKLIASNDEGRAFHRHGPPFRKVRSVTTIASRPGSPFTEANITGINEFRNRVAADIEVPNGPAPALISFSRPYFEGYRASLGNKQIPVTSERGLFPMVEIPPGSKGRLVLEYRPAWLVYGGTVALGCAAVWLICVIAAAWPRPIPLE